MTELQNNAVIGQNVEQEIGKVRSSLKGASFRASFKCPECHQLVFSRNQLVVNFVGSRPTIPSRLGDPV